MKHSKKLNWLVAVSLLLGITTKSFSQTIKDFFSTNSIQLTYLGIDYYKARMINNPGANISDYKNRLFNAMNQVVIDEMPKNYDFAKSFNRTGNVSSDISTVTARNGKINEKDIPSSNDADFNRLSEEDITSEVKALNFKSADGIGLVFIMEAMKKGDKKGYGSVWVTLIDMKTRKVIMTERMEQEAAGFGDRNYWVSIIKKSLIEINKKKYKEWKAKYGG